MIIICTNTGRLRAFRVTEDDARINQIREIANEEFDRRPQRVGELATDQAGRFNSDGSPGMATGEAHGVEQEEERRLISQLAETIGDLVNAEKPDWWSLAAPKPINARLVEELDPEVLQRMTANEPHDYTKLPTHEVGRRFGLIK